RSRVLRARRGHLRNPWDLSELTFQGRGNRSRHGLSAGAMQRGTDADGREIDLRQRRYRQKWIGDEADEADRSRHERCRNRPPSAGLGNMHEEGSRFAIVGAAGMFSLTSEFCRSLYWPSTTTRSPSTRPEVMTVRSPDVGPDLMGRA